MKITLIVVGKLKEKFLVDGVAEYLKRLKKFATVEVREIPECRTVEEEGQKILSLVQKDSWLCVLDVSGAALSSAKKLSRLSICNE